MSTPDSSDEHYYDATSAEPDKEKEREAKTEDNTAHIPSESQSQENNDSALSCDQVGLTKSSLPAQEATSDHVYFILEKEEDSDHESEQLVSREEKFKTARMDVGNFRGQTSTKSNVNVLSKAKMFEGENNVEKDLPQKPVKKKGKQGVTFENNNVEKTQGSFSDFPVYEFAKVLPSEQGPDADVYDRPSLQAQVNQTKIVGKGDDPGLVCQKNSSSENLHYMVSNVPVFAEKASTNSPSSVQSSVNQGCKVGVGQAVPVDFINPVSESDSDKASNSEYSRLYFKNTTELTDSMRERLRDRGYAMPGSFPSSSERREEDSFGEEMPNPDEDSDLSAEEEDLSFDWGSEFDEISLQSNPDDDFDALEAIYSGSAAPEKPLPPKPGKTRFNPQMLLAKRSSQVEPLPLNDPSSTSCLPVTINPDKHPPPSLPTAPSGLTEAQKKRRCVVDLIISSERSYLESLERILQQYERPVLEAIPHPKSHVRKVFAQTREIISHHKMFQIELAESVRNWDEEETIGNIFTASFSKTMLVNAYSIYVNNFAATMEEIRVAQRNKQSFDNFLRSQERSNVDRLSIFGLMVKPVQRFPQFIMLLQDLIKFMPQDHHDRRKLQVALTELENVTHKLNERKRHSEQRFLAQQALHQLTRQKVQHMLSAWNLDLDSKRRLIRFDAVEQVYGEFGQMKCKDRRLILLNDFILCVKVLEKEQAGFRVERLGLRWMAKLRDVEVKDSAITPDMQSIIRKEPDKIHIISSQIDKPEEDPFHLYCDLSEMLHDYTVLGQMSGLLASLKRSYAGHGLTEELVHEVARDLQRMIQIKDEQLRLVNSCSILLVDNSRSDKPHYVLQTQTAAIKQDWCVDFLMAKLALDKSNRPAWDGSQPSDDQDFDPVPAHFMKFVPVDVPRNYTKIRCAVSVFLSPENCASGLGVQHLWVCSSTSTRGQVSILSIHNSKPALTESFRACQCDILCVELVPGCGESTVCGDYTFASDTVWVSTAHSEILIFPVTSTDSVRRDPLAVVKLQAMTVTIKFVDERLFCGYHEGTMGVYSRSSVGAWSISTPVTLSFGLAPVKIHFVHDEDLWLSCAAKLFVLEIDSLENKAVHLLNSNHTCPIDLVVKSGVGIWVSFHDSACIKLFHLETMDNLQEMSVGNFISRIVTEKLWSLGPVTDPVVVTSLTVSKGLLWIGTSLGVVLTLPLPRLSDGVPLYRGRPHISLHSHRGPVRFVLPLQCSTSTLEINRASTLRSTLSLRRSARNLERERLEFEESERRKGSWDSRRSHGGIVRRKSSLDVSPVKKQQNFMEAESSQNSLPSSTPDVDLALRKWEESAGMADAGGQEKMAAEEAGKFPDSGECRDTGRNDNRKSFDDGDVLLREKGQKNVSRSNRQSRTLSFRSELAQRIMVTSQAMSQSLDDLRFSEPLEVEVLYENLLEEEPGMEEGRDVNNAAVGREGGEAGNIGSQSDSPAASSTSHNSSPASEHTHSRAFPPWKKSLQRRVAKHQDNLPSQSPSSSSNVSSSPSSSSSLGGMDSPKLLSRSSMKGRAHSKDNIFKAGTLRTTTSRKSGSSSNAVIVVSGGDGYCDLDMSRSQSKTDDAGVMLWIYKF